jgi:hypothetical protein
MMRYLTDFKWSVIEPLLPCNHLGVRDRQADARASVAELEAGLIGERTRPDMLESIPAFNYISLGARGGADSCGRS